MRKSSKILMCLIATITIVGAASIVWAADSSSNSSSNQTTNSRRGGRGQRGGRGMFGDFQQRIKEMIKSELKASDAEWTIIEPRLTKVMTLSRELNSRMPRGMMGGGPGGRNRRGSQNSSSSDNTNSNRPPMPEGAQSNGPDNFFGGDSQQKEQSDIEKASSALRKALEQETVDATVVKEKLIALRATRMKAKQELAKAQKNLRGILTLEQEAKLVLFGLLD